MSKCYAPVEDSQFLLDAQNAYNLNIFSTNEPKQMKLQDEEEYLNDEATYEDLVSTFYDDISRPCDQQSRALAVFCRL